MAATGWRAVTFVSLLLSLCDFTNAGGVDSRLIRRESLQDGRLRLSARGRQGQVPLVPGNAAPTAGPAAPTASAAPAAPAATIAPTTAPTGPAVTALAVTSVPSAATPAAKVHTVKTEVREVREVTEKTDEKKGEDEDGADRKDKEHKDQEQGKDERKPKEEKVTQMPGWTIAAGGVLLAAGALGVFVWSRRPEPKLKQDKPRTSILSKRSNMSAEEKGEKGARRSIREGSSSESERQKSRRSRTEASKNASQRGSLSKKDPEKSKGSKAANADAEVIATEGAAAKGGYKNRKQNATKAADAKKQKDEPIVPPATEVPDAEPPKNGEASAEGTPAETNTARPSAYRSRKQNQPAAAEKPAEGTPPTPPESVETPTPLPAVPDAATPKNGEASGEGAPADTTTARPSAYRSRKQNQPAAAEKPAEGTPPTPPASEETPAPLPAVPDAATTPKNGEASGEGAPADTTTARPSAYRSRKQNQPAAAEKPAEGTPPTPPASEETPAPLPAVPDAATPKNGEASGEGAPADTTTARPSAYRSRKQNQSSSASSGPSAVALSPESLGNTADSGGRSSYRQRRQSAAAAKPETRPSANRSRTQDQPAAEAPKDEDMF